MDRHFKGSPAYMEDLLKQVEQQITISKNLITVSKEVVARSKEHYRQHAAETEVYLELFSINNKKPLE